MDILNKVMDPQDIERKLSRYSIRQTVFAVLNEEDSLGQILKPENRTLSFTRCSHTAILNDSCAQ